MNEHLKSKNLMAVITDAEIRYELSRTISSDIFDLARIRQYQKVMIRVQTKQKIGLYYMRKYNRRINV